MDLVEGGVNIPSRGWTVEREMANDGSPPTADNL